MIFYHTIYNRIPVKRDFVSGTRKNVKIGNFRVYAGIPSGTAPYKIYKYA